MRCARRCLSTVNAFVGLQGERFDIEVFYVEDGSLGCEPVLLIMGLGTQLIPWPQDLVDRLADKGYRVIRLDNRDCGMSTRLDGVPKCTALTPAPYQLTDMATDVVGLARASWDWAGSCGWGIDGRDDCPEACPGLPGEGSQFVFES